jgi:hypothetical protein
MAHKFYQVLFIYVKSIGARQSKKNILFMAIIIAVSLLFSLNALRAQAGEKDRFTSKPNTGFCINLSAIKSLKTCIAQHNKKTFSQLIKEGKCTVSQSSLVVYVVQENKEFVRVLPAGTSNYRWIFKDSLQ